jgi:mono/diheme cytochrome c family protein
MPELPDFTSITWQKSRTDAEFSQSILLGKGKYMLPMSDKLGDVDIKQMVTLVRGFQGGKQVIAVEEPKLPGPPAPAIVTAPSSPVPLPSSPKIELPLVAPSGETAARIRVGGSIFRQYCIVCHGTDGKGTAMRPVLPPIPDFTSAAFQKEHSDAQIQVSILDGKGTLMPANRGRVTEDQASDLIAFIRAFGGGPRPVASKPRVSDWEQKYYELEGQWNALESDLQKTQGPPK